MSLQALSPASHHHVRVALAEVFKDYVRTADEVFSWSLTHESASVLSDAYSRDAFYLLHDLGGMASPW